MDKDRFIDRDSFIRGLKRVLKYTAAVASAIIALMWALGIGPKIMAQTIANTYMGIRHPGANYKSEGIEFDDDEGAYKISYMNTRTGDIVHLKMDGKWFPSLVSYDSQLSYTQNVIAPFTQDRQTENSRSGGGALQGCRDAEK